MIVQKLKKNLEGLNTLLKSNGKTSQAEYIEDLLKEIDSNVDGTVEDILSAGAKFEDYANLSVEESQLWKEIFDLADNFHLR